MSFIQSFPPIVGSNASRLILGSMPGKASLLANEYYAHPRNAFWPIMSHILGFPLGLSYSVRINQVLDRQIAIWDVLQQCTRTSSLDSDIQPDSIVMNDLPGFLSTYPTIRHIYFNGQKAAELYRRYVRPKLSSPFANIPLSTLPSTSPANASIPITQKRLAWSVIQQ